MQRSSLLILLLFPYDSMLRERERRVVTIALSWKEFTNEGIEFRQQMFKYRETEIQFSFVRTKKKRIFSRNEIMHKYCHVLIFPLTL